MSVVFSAAQIKGNTPVSIKPMELELSLTFSEFTTAVQYGFGRHTWEVPKPDRVQALKVRYRSDPVRMYRHFGQFLSLELSIRAKQRVLSDL